MNRRRFLKASLLTSATAALAGSFSSVATASIVPKRILVLGGTFFLGPALVDNLLADGHTVTLFNRGVTNPDLFPRLERLRGFRSSDRGDQDLAALTNRHFDAIVDVWPNDPEVASSAAELLRSRAQHYLYVSSIGAYDSKEFSKDRVEEDAPLQAWDSQARPYNRNKAESERRLRRIIGDRLTIVRPGPIKGHRDTTPDLLTWLLRCQQGGKHIAPGNGSDPVELVDVKDVARFLVMAIDRGLFGTFNLTGKAMTFREFLDACNSATRSDAKFVWIPQQFLHEHGLESDSVLHTFSGNFPFWRPDPSNQGLYRVSSDKAYGAGWRTRAFEETTQDVLADYYSFHTIETTEYLPPEKEREVLAAWQRQRD